MSNLNNSELVIKNSDHPSLDDDIEILNKQIITTNNNREIITQLNNNYSVLSFYNNFLIKNWISEFIKSIGYTISKGFNYLFFCKKKGNITSTTLTDSTASTASTSSTALFDSTLLQNDGIKKFKQSKKCFYCNSMFGISLYRSHCRTCGNSFCDQHSNFYNNVNGYAGLQRTCLDCNNKIKQQELDIRSKYRDQQILKFICCGNITTFEEIEDSFRDKALRITNMSIHVLTRIPTIGGVPALIIASADLVTKYGHYGIASLLLRNEILEIADIMRELNNVVFEPDTCDDAGEKNASGGGEKNASGGDEKNSCASKEKKQIHDIVGGLYYLFCQKRGERGNDPTFEAKQHFVVKPEVEIKSEVEVNPEVDVFENDNYNLVPSEFLQNIIDIAPFALNIAYLSTAEEMARLLRLLNYSLLFVNLYSQVEEPVFYLAISKNKTAIIGVRGTNSVHDALTNLKAKPELFTVGGKDYYTHGGMMRASVWLYNEIKSCLTILNANNYKLILTGHSYAAGVVCLLTTLIKEGGYKGQVECFAFATPAIADNNLCEKLNSDITTIILHNDIIPRFTPHSTRKLYIEVSKFEYKHLLEQDMVAYKKKISSVWAPKTRIDSGGVLPHIAELEQKSIIPIISNNIELDDSDDDDDDEYDFVNLPPRLYPMGNIIHIWKIYGIYKASFVDRHFPSLKQIELFSDCISDHSCASYMECLKSSLKPGTTFPQPWMPFCNATVCATCFANFSWNSTSLSKAQNNLDKHVCHYCGLLVCESCSKTRSPIIKYNINVPVRICDKCVHSI